VKVEGSSPRKLPEAPAGRGARTCRGALALVLGAVLLAAGCGKSADSEGDTPPLSPEAEKKVTELVARASDTTAPASKADLVKLRYFAGLTIEQSAKTLGISHATAERYWDYACSWLRLEILRTRQKRSC